MGPRLETLQFGGRERGVPMEGVIIIVGVGKERLGYFISRVWNGWDGALRQQIPAMRNSHLESRSSSGIPNYYFRAEGVSFFIGADSDCSNPWTISLNGRGPQFERGPHQIASNDDQAISKIRQGNIGELRVAERLSQPTWMFGFVVAGMCIAFCLF